MALLTDLAWLAGLVEGEGCFTTQYKRRLPRLLLDMTDEDVVRRAQSVTGLGKVRGPYAPSGNRPQDKPRWRWDVSRKSEFLQVVQTIYPLLGSRRQARALEILKAIA